MPISRRRSLYFENGIGRIWEESAGYIRLEYHPGPREAVPFRALLTHLSQALALRQWAKILVDQRAMVHLESSEMEWMATQWLPRAVNEQGYRYGAVLVAHNVFARLAMTQLVLATHNLPHVYRTFDSETEALDWLASIAG